MKSKNLGGALAILITALCAQSAHAVAISGAMHEPFAYAEGTQFPNFTSPNNSTMNGGQGFNASGTTAANAINAGWADPAVSLAAPNGLGGYATNAAQHTATSPGLTSTAVGYLAASGAKLTLDAATTNQTQQQSRLLGGQVIDSGALFMSFLVSRNNDTNRTINLALFGKGNLINNTERVAFGQIGAAAGTSGGSIAMLLNNQNPAGLVQNTTSPIAMQTGVAHLIVVRIDFNNSTPNATTLGTNDTVSMWVDPLNVTNQAAALTPYLSANTFDLGNIEAVRPFVGNNVGNPVTIAAVSANFDEIRFGGTWESVTSQPVPVPEPATCCLLICMVAAMPLFRRTH